MAVLLSVQSVTAAPCDFRNFSPDRIRHDLSVSYCELCGYGYITIVIANPYERVDMTDMTVVENLGASGLTYDPTAPDPITYSVNGGPSWTGGAPIIGGSNGSLLSWTQAQIPPLAQLEYDRANRFNTIAITFAVTRAGGLTQEGLVSASRSIEARLEYSTAGQCFPGYTTVSTGVDTLPLHEPDPDVAKGGRNIDANQDDWTSTVYGHDNDDIIWRIQVSNSGLADLQDLRFDDVMQGGSMQVNYACPSDAEAFAIAANDGNDSGSRCVAIGNTIGDFDVDNPFGNPGGDTPDLVDVVRGGSGYIYLVGKVDADGSCDAGGPRTNTVDDVQWGCEADSPPAGGIAETSDGGRPGSATTTLYTYFGDRSGALTVVRRLTGVNTDQPVGSRGTMTIVIRNATGGSVKNIRLEDVLPPEYVMDPSFTPALVMDPRYGAYAGMIDNITWDNPDADPLNNTAPVFTLTSDGCSEGACAATVHPDYPDQRDMMRDGDELTITFRVVLIEPPHYDKTADIDVREESFSDGTDPDNRTTLTNQLTVEYDTFCGAQGHQTLNFTDSNIPAFPEDLDIDIAGNLIYILTGDRDQTLPLTVNLTNRGGHDAEDYVAYVSFGVTMEVVSAPAGCAPTTNPPPHDVWRDPAEIPPDAAVYECTGGAIAPGQTVPLTFEVIKSDDPAAIQADDLTFRADVVGEIHLYDGTALTFPAPVNPRSDLGNDAANNYSLDAIRARVIGFNLLKTQLGDCSENNPPPASPDRLVQIGEECSYHIETGGWFGFATPGYALIAVQDITVFDQLPDGQGYIWSTPDPSTTSTPAIQAISLNPPPVAPNEVFPPEYLNWTFNWGDGQRIIEKDHWFRADLTSRLLNDPVDVSAAPNQHAAPSTNELVSTFLAIFQSETGDIVTHVLGPDTVGYPRAEVRRVELTVTEPNLTVVKEVCNESLYGVGPACSNFVPLADDGDAYDAYIYRLTVTNEAAADGVGRAPAYDVTVTDRLDASDLTYVLPLAADGLDNDGDGDEGGADADGEGTISDNTVRNGVPGEIQFSYTHSSALRRIDAGQSVRLFYRVDFDDDAAPLQTFTNSADAVYDSLEGPSGNQSAPQGANSEIAGARVYTSTPGSAAVRIIPVETRPKRIAALSNTPLSAGPDAQGVSIGEEVEFRFTTSLPVALLRDFVIRDELPAGLRCTEAPVIDLDAPPYAEAQFVPGGMITPTCTDSLVEWDFGDQRVTNGTAGNRYDLDIGFIARVENTAATNEGDVIANGHPATVATAQYVDEAGNLVSHDFGQVEMLVREPRIELTKTLAAAAADAADIVTVTVTAVNTGTTTAYNLRVLDDLDGRHLAYAGNVAGADPPDTVDTTTLGADRPIFGWNGGIAAGESIAFTFDIRVEDEVQPLEVLDNTIQAAWTSLPGQTTALNSTGSIGADGGEDGMRIGALPPAGDAVNDYESDAASQAAVPPLVLTKTDLDPALIPAIGAHRSFQIDIRLPEGVTRDLVVTDRLDAGVVSYVLENNAAYDITYSFQDIASINGASPDEAVFIAAPADGSAGTVVWNIGTVVTRTEDDTAQNEVDPLIRIQYRARVNNDLDTDDGDTLQNGATLTYTNGESGATETLTDDAAAVTAVEPLLTISKTVANVTAGKQPSDPPGGGDLLEYVVTIPNGGTAAAHDVTVTDTLPAGLALYAGFTPTAAVAGSPVPGFVAEPANAPHGPLIWGRGNGDDSLDIPVGQTLVLTYRVVVEEAAGDLNNRAWVDWTSLDGPSAYERTGDGCPTWTAPDDYCAGPAVAALASVDDNAIAKEVAADTYDVPPLSTASDAVARVGDTVTYRLALNLRGGLTRDVQVQDVLPDGMAFVDIVHINGDTTADYTPPASGAGSNFSYDPITVAEVPAAGQTGTLTWRIGDIDNDPFGDPTTDIFEIVYRARVLPDSGIAHVAATTLENTATLDYLDAPVLSDGAVVTLHQPVIDAVTKTERSGLSSPAAVDVAADTMQFRLEACNSGQAPAYSVAVSDELAMQLDESSIANVSVAVDGTVLTAGSDYVYTPPAARGGTLSFLLSTPVNPGQCVTIDYDIGFHTDFGPNQVWHNSVTVDAYWSLPAQSGQQYGPVGPATFSMHNVADTEPPDKSIVSPSTGEATIGEEVVYHITVPAAPVNAAMYDVTIADTLSEVLELVSIAEISGNGFVLTDTSVPPDQINLTIDQIPAGSQAVVELRVRLRNIDAANAGDTFVNSVLYTFADTPGGEAQGGGSDTTPAVRIVEPSLSLSKSVVNVTRPGDPPQAGDILRYTLSVSAAGGTAGDNFSDAYDLRIDDHLSLGLVYHGNAAVNGAGNTIGDPVVAGDGSTAAQSLVWRAEDSNADIDVAEGATVDISYDVRVLDEVLSGQVLGNSAVVQWTGLDGPDAGERNGSGSPACNDYITAPAATELTVPDNTTVSKTRLEDTFGPGDAEVRIGDILVYELRLGLQEGAHANLVLTDTLPQGLVFEEIAAINGDVAAPFTAVAPFVHADITASDIVVSGDPAAGPTTITWHLGDIDNPADGDSSNDQFVIVYRARVLDNVHPHVDTIGLTNSLDLDRDTAGGPAPTLTADETVTVVQPRLTVSKSAAAAGGDAVLEAGEIVTYTVDIANTGTAPAYDAVLTDTIPAGLRNGAATITVTDIRLLSGAALPILSPVYDAATGLATWNFDTGTAGLYAIPPGDSLRIIYQVQADASIGAGMTLTNQAQVQRYYSLDDEALPAMGAVIGVPEIYGPSNVASVTLTTDAPDALAKENPAVSTAAVGEPFAYRITVPATPLATALHDVRITDDLSASAADLRFVGVTKISGSQPWTPVNTGTDTQLVIEDTTIGIDIPAGEQIVIEITVVLEDTATNVPGLTFSNTADYTYNPVDNDPATQLPGGPDTTDDMTIVGADSVTVEKSGPGAVQLGTIGAYTLDLHNTSLGTVWNPILTDRLPDTEDGGFCAAGPGNVTAQIFLADGVTPVSAALEEGTDFTVTFDGAPSCEWRFALLSAAGGVPADHRLIIHYELALDPDTENGATLTNIAGATRWYSADPNAPGAVPRIYDRVLTDGTPGTLDHEDAHTITAEAPILEFHKSVQNMTTGQDPGSHAGPGDTLRYTIRITNSGSVGLDAFSIVDEPDALNAVPVFAGGTLSLVSVPAGADVSATDANGGAHGTGLLQVGDLRIGAQGAPDDTLVLVFDIDLAPVIASGTLALNQARLVTGSADPLLSDDPNLPGDLDPTETLITSAPVFEVLKTAAILEGDPDVLMAGESLRYTLTIRNIGNEDAVDVVLRDNLPAHTAYIAGSTTLNGVAVPDAGPGVSPLFGGMLVNAPADPTPGALPADVPPDAANIATVTFDVRIDADAMDGLIIENQGFLDGGGAGSGPQPEQPSDDPGTPAPDDPTCVVVGNLPLLYAHKTVEIHEDFGSPGIVDPGDVLRYTIVVSNSGAIPATGVVLTDTVPDHTAYLSDSLRLNGASVGPDGGVFPLIAGLPLTSADQPGAGIISPGGSAVVTFEVRVDAGVPSGTLITNQGSVASTELPPEPTDADGLPDNGDQPTVIVVGDVQLLTITKDVSVPGGGAAVAGGQLEYVIRVTNIGSLPATGVVITDDLNPPLGDQVAYVAGSGALNGLPAGVTYAGGVLTADYAGQYGDLLAGDSAVLRFRVQIDAALALGTTITNTGVVRWSDPAQTASATVSIDLGGTPGSGAINGNVWHDANLDQSLDATAETCLEGWTVELYRNGQPVATATTDAGGAYRIGGLIPNDGTTDLYELRFRAAGAGPGTASLGYADSPFTDGPQHISEITVASGDNLQNLNLPLWPNGVVYNSVAREPVAGATLTLTNAATGAALPPRCFDDPLQQNQVTALGGFYKFDLNFSDAACPAGGAYLIEVTPPSTGYQPGISQVIPPASDATTAPFSIPTCPGSPDDAVPSTTEYCEAAPSALVPPASVPPRSAGTTYYLHLVLDDGHLPGHSQVFNNPIPIDPVLDGAVAITKTASVTNVTRGALVPYTITVTNVFGVPLYDLAIGDRFPAGFKYVAGSARLDGQPAEPRVEGRELIWDGLALQVNQKYTLKFLLVVGAGVSEGEFVNRAIMLNTSMGTIVSEEATATVRLIPDPDFDCTDVIGKVFDDRNLNGRQEEGEAGLAGVRVVTARGLIAVTDALGRFHITCATVPDQDRGSNFILKLDERSLPSGYRMTTENPRVQRATRGKALRFNFGATIHRVVRIDIADGVFEPDTTDLRPQWRSTIDRLVEELHKAPSVLRLSYLADIERESMVHDRLDALKKEIAGRWEEEHGVYSLTVETEIFWRLGAPVDSR